MLKYRVISFPILLGLVFAVFFWREGGPWLFAALTLPMMAALTWDFLTIAGKLGFPSFHRMTSLFMGLFFSFVAFSQVKVMPSGLFSSVTIAVLAFFFLGWGGMIFAKDKGMFFRKFITSVGAATILTITFFPLLLIYFGQATAMAYGFLFLVLCTKMMDTGGYVAGMLSARWMPGGNHKIMPSISPKKSWEGTFGGIVFSMAAAALFWKYDQDFHARGLRWCLISGFVLALGSFAGDLTESALKRSAELKDSGRYIPGMGGMFDVLDSFIYNGMLFVFLQAMNF